MVASLEIIDREILDLERGKEDGCGGEGGGVLYGRGERSETGLIQAACWRLRDAKDSCSCAHYARAEVALLSGGKGYGDDEKGI